MAARALSLDSIDLSWSPVISKGESAASYVLEIENNIDKNYTQIYEGPETKYTKTGLQMNTEYTFRVCSTFEEIKSDFAVVKQRTLWVTIPTNFSGRPTSWNKISLSWDMVKGLS